MVGNNVNKTKVIGFFIIIIAAVCIGIFIGLLIKGKGNIRIIGDDKLIIKRNNNDQEEKKNAVVKITNEKINTDDAKYYMVVKGLDDKNNEVWTYTTGTDYVAQIDLLEFLQENGDTVYINEHGKIVALNKQDGKVIWENTDYKGGGSSHFKFDENGCLYLSSAMSLDLLAIDSNGKTMKKISKVSDTMFWPTDLSLEEGYVKLTFEVTGFSGDKDNNYVYFELDDLKNTNNNIIAKEIVPEFLHRQIEGFEDIKSFVLDSNGDVFIKFEPDSELQKKYLNTEGKYKIATGIKNIYVLNSGNGGFGDFVAVANDGTMFTISSYSLKETGNIEIKGTNETNVDYIIAIKGFDAYYFNIVDKSGNCKIF